MGRRGEGVPGGVWGGNGKRIESSKFKVQSEGKRSWREPSDPKAQTERGWLVWFIRQGRHRILYAVPREGAEETLAAVCELRY